MGMSSPHINQLPAEIFNLIFNNVRNAGPIKNFLPCLSVCQLWRRIGVPIAWSTVILTSQNLGPFVLRAESNLLVCGSISSLSFLESSSKRQLENRILLNQGCDAVEKNSLAKNSLAEQRGYLERLAVLIKDHMSMLTTFSFCVFRQPQSRSKGVNGEPPGTRFTTQNLDNLLRALPPSCTNLELDTGGKEGNARGSEHLCSTIRTLLPQLKHVRLRLRCLCPGIIEETYGSPPGQDQSTRCITFPLRTLILNLNLNPFSIGIRGCDGFDSTATIPIEKRLDAFRVQSEVAEAFHRALKAHAFPDLEHLDILDVHDSKMRAFDHIHLQDIIKYETYELPFRLLNENARSWMIISKSNDMCFGSMVDTERLVEGPASFSETLEGARFPASFAATTRASELGFQWSRPCLIDRSEFLRLRDAGHCPKWAEEAWNNAKDSRAVVRSGF